MSACDHECPGGNCAPDRCCEDCVGEPKPWAHPDTMIGRLR